MGAMSELARQEAEREEYARERCIDLLDALKDVLRVVDFYALNQRFPANVPEIIQARALIRAMEEQR